MLQAASRKNQCPEYPARSSLFRRFDGLNYVSHLQRELCKYAYQSQVHGKTLRRYANICGKKFGATVTRSAMDDQDNPKAVWMSLVVPFIPLAFPASSAKTRTPN
ncbi:hypothetical protein D3C71_1442940 [compost metagenome]